MVGERSLVHADTDDALVLGMPASGLALEPLVEISLISGEAYCI